MWLDSERPFDSFVFSYHILSKFIRHLKLQMPLLGLMISTRVSSYRRGIHLPSVGLALARVHSPNGVMVFFRF